MRTGRAPDPWPNRSAGRHGRHHAYQELREPGAYFRVLATAARTQATRRAPDGSVSAVEMRARIDARIDEAGPDESDRR